MCLEYEIYNVTCRFSLFSLSSYIFCNVTHIIDIMCASSTKSSCALKNLKYVSSPKCTVLGDLNMTYK